MKTRYEGECFLEIINTTPTEVLDPGPLHSPIKSFSIQRDKKFQLIITTTSDYHSTSAAKEFPEGTVRHVEESLTLKCGNFKIGINSVIPQECIKSTEKGIIENALIQNIEGVIDDPEVSSYLIEWLENVDHKYYSYTDLLQKVTESKVKFIFESQNPIYIKDESTTNIYHRCINIKVSEHEIYFARSLKNDKNLNSGFILYKGCPSGEVRKKIRESLSFAMGNYLVYLGCTKFSKTWEVISFEAVSPYKFSNRIDDRTIPPAPLDEHYFNLIDSRILSRIVNSIYLNYDLCNFSHISELYWDGVFSQINIAAVYFGAAIESIKYSYIEKMNSKFKKSILDDETWENIKDDLLNLISKFDIESENKKIIINKITGLNSAPKDLLTKRFFEVLNIDFKELEKNAWRRRDYAAHGANKDDDIDLIRDVKILKIILNRIILAICKSHEFYYDYYTIGNPYRFIRKLKDSIPNSEQNQITTE